MSEHPQQLGPAGQPSGPYPGPGAPGYGYAPGAPGYGQQDYHPHAVNACVEGAGGPLAPAQAGPPASGGQPGAPTQPHAAGGPPISLILACASLFALTLITPIVAFVLYTALGPASDSLWGPLPGIAAALVGTLLMGIAIAMAHPVGKPRRLAFWLLGGSCGLSILTSAVYGAIALLFNGPAVEGDEALLMLLVLLFFPFLYGIANGLLISAYLAARGFHWWAFLMATAPTVIVRVFENAIVTRMLGDAGGSRAAGTLVQCIGAIVFGVIYSAILLIIVLICTSAAKRSQARAAGSWAHGAGQAYGPGAAPGYGGDPSAWAGQPGQAGANNQPGAGQAPPGQAYPGPGGMPPAPGQQWSSGPGA
ncbi:hypothetical protein BRM1_11765 [Brevibacterium sp. BRM-1]|uniref:hypothetical protein n=1 Tax=Brevibacterium sp. BRM-1 TaxID=2999062 RepID=UPI00227E8A2A|nr:hypothetical protein [Brevibacterium sp. BRM-1]WAL39912.1 hypothetical protein BRM1_11765 [Brevibacterium sp. BRM-1]